MGGTDGIQSLSSAVNSYDIDFQNWTQLHSMNTPRAYGFAAASQDGTTIYAFGGFNGTAFVRTFEMYDIKTDHWTLMSGTMPFAHSRGSSAVIGDDVFFIGGEDSFGVPSANFTSYNMPNNYWKVWNQTLPVGRSNLTAVSVDNNIYVLGGRNSTTNLTERVDIFDTNTQNWRRSNDYPFPRENMCATNANGLVVLAGGYNPQGGSSHNSVMMLNPRMSSWRNDLLNALNYGRDSCSMVFVDGTIFTLGGRYYNVSEKITSLVSSMETVKPCF